MPNGIPGQIISELGELGKKVGGEVAKVPKDIAGKALESMGTSSGKTGAAAAKTPGGTEIKSDSMWDKIALEKDQKVKRSIARKALEDLVNKAPQRREPSIWERLQMEQEQKKQMMQQKAGSGSPLPMPASKRPRGDLYGAKAKKTATENKNIRQD